jgi:hypothetical protein
MRTRGDGPSQDQTDRAGNREVLAFFDLSHAGEVFVNRHFVVPDSLKAE